MFIYATAKDSGIKVYVDTGPLLERALAEQSGLGNIGKNACLINKKFGSWILLAELITTLELPHTLPKQQNTTPFDICKSCTKCIAACPTKAIIAPGVINAKKCISFLTIENKGNIPKKEARWIKKSKRVFGCDICQEVCPLNKHKKTTTNQEFLVPRAGDQVSIDEIQEMNEAEFLQKYAGSPLMRTKLSGMRRNTAVLRT